MFILFNEIMIPRPRASARFQEWSGGHGERGSASLYGGLGAMPPVGSRGKAPGQGGAKPPEAESFLHIRRLNLLEYVHALRSFSELLCIKKIIFFEKL